MSADIPQGGEDALENRRHDLRTVLRLSGNYEGLSLGSIQGRGIERRFGEEV